MLMGRDLVGTPSTCMTHQKKWSECLPISRSTGQCITTGVATPEDLALGSWGQTQPARDSPDGSQRDASFPEPVAPTYPPSGTDTTETPARARKATTYPQHVQSCTTSQPGDLGLAS